MTCAAPRKGGCETKKQPVKGVKDVHLCSSVPLVSVVMSDRAYSFAHPVMSYGESSHQPTDQQKDTFSHFNPRPAFAAELTMLDLSPRYFVLLLPPLPHSHSETDQRVLSYVCYPVYVFPFSSFSTQVSPGRVWAQAQHSSARL